MSLLSIFSLSFSWASSVGGGGDYAIIQDAIDAAVDGETITIASGNYSECLDTLGKNVTFQGSGSVFIDTSGCSLGDQNDHGINISLGEAVYFSDVSFENNDGGVFFVDSSSLFLSNVEVSDSGSNSTKGAAVYAINNANIDVSGSVFYNNGGTTSGTNTVKGAVVFLDDGAALNVHSGTIFDNNFAYQGGAIAGLDDVEIVIDDSSFTNNSVLSRGGAILLYPTSSTSVNQLHISDSTFSSNTVYVQQSVSGSSGGAVYVTGITDVQILNTDFDNNSAKLDGGVAYFEGIAGTVEIDGCNFENNTADHYAGALHGRSDGSLAPTYFEISNSHFTQPSSAVCFGTGSDLCGSSGLGGFVALGTPQSTQQSHVGLTVLNSHFEGAEADNSQEGLGGAIGVYSNTDHSISVQHSHFAANRAELSGGAIFVYGAAELNIFASTFLENRSEGPSSTYDRYGGAIFADSVVSLSISNSLFGANYMEQGNSSDGAGGAVYAQLVSELNVYNTIFAENESSSKGGSVAFDSVVDLEIINNNILSTVAADGAAWFGNITAAEISNNVFADSQSAALVTDNSLTVSNNNWYNNTSNSVGNTVVSVGSDGNIAEPPQFTAYTADGNFENDNYALICTSALIDAGLYSDTSSGFCSNNSALIADIGAFGGENFVDEDSDGFSVLFDCEDDPINGGIFAYPGAAELESLSECMMDADEDGYGDALATGSVVAGGDCDDSEGAAYPGAAELESTVQCLLDADDDGYGAEAPDNTAIGSGDDCDDSNPAVSPDIPEDPATSYDDNCDGSLTLIDGDGDGFSSTLDCDDTDPNINSAADELCDGLDNNCDGQVDEATAVDASVWYLDYDGDGFGEESSAFNQMSCEAPAGYSATADDCDPFDADIYPGATEIVGDGVDQDCDGVDAAPDSPDADGDGLCDSSGISVSLDQDCDGILNVDDGDADGDGVCDSSGISVSLDQDCDGILNVDDGDADGDGVCDLSGVSVSDDLDCDGLLNADDDDADGDGISKDEDCDDLDSELGAVALDEDCDGILNEGDLDSDGDGICDSGETLLADDSDCDGSLNDEDCAPFDPDVYPGATEIADDGIDQDCDERDLTSANEDTASEEDDDTGVGTITVPPSKGWGCNTSGSLGEAKHGWMLALIGLLLYRRRED